MVSLQAGLADVILTPEQLQAVGDFAAHIPPPGMTSNFVNPYDLEHTDYAVMAVALMLPTVAVVLRVYSKIAIVRELNMDDYVLMLGWAFYAVYCAFTAILARDHLARHQWDVQIKDLTSILYSLHIEMILYGITTTLIKTSIALQYLSLFSPPGNRGFMFWSCWGLIGFLVAFYVAGTFAEIFICSPVKKFWYPLSVEGHCIKYLVLNVVAGTVNAVTDLIIIILPQRTIWKLNLTTARKLKASAIFMIGLIALVASVMRLYYAVELMQSTDATWNANMMGLWTFLEMVTTIICSCLPSLARLATMWTPSILSFRKRMTTRGGSESCQLSGNEHSRLHSSDGREQSLVMKSMYKSSSSIADLIDYPLALPPDEEGLFKDIDYCHAR